MTTFFSSLGIGTEMYYYPSKDAGVILFINTDIDQSDHQAYSDIDMMLYEYAQKLKNQIDKVR